MAGIVELGAYFKSAEADSFGLFWELTEWILVTLTGL